ncbi:hypothetical protein QYM36_013615 [Artemia franciscana]|uniref:Uncharacterized protein n=1 Tax=Artemia franciscana TaxID=6661 RepID=A0AA88L1J4_ARTSF|nr:hypothetical protein QYM36_013615 [Artemia franciscana]
MDCQVTTPRIESIATRGILASNDGSPGHDRSPAKANHVNFDEKVDESKEKRERFLTAKYGSHQMSLIRKRLSVEMWMYDRLQDLYGCTDDTQTHDVDLDLDELLDLDDDISRKRFLRVRYLLFFSYFISFQVLSRAFAFLS